MATNLALDDNLISEAQKMSLVLVDTSIWSEALRRHMIMLLMEDI